LSLAERIIAFTAIAGCFLITLFVCLITKPTYENMRSDIFLKIGGNNNMWEVYKNFCMCSSIMKYDLILSFLFLVTIFFLTYHNNETLYFLPIDIFMTGLCIGIFIIGNQVINRKKKGWVFMYVSFRLFLEAYKLFKTVMINLNYDA